MIRGPFTAAFMVSLLLLGLATPFLWVRSCHRADTVERELFDQPHEDLPRPLG